MPSSGECSFRPSPALAVFLLVLFSCTTNSGTNPLDTYEELDATTILDAPCPRPGQCAPENRDRAIRGQYLVELLGCGACHTDGALIGEVDLSRSLAGSRIGIAFSNPLGDKYPAVIYPSNITPDVETGIGLWSDEQIANAIRAGAGRHGSRQIPAMPWPGYAKISGEDIEAITTYLRSIEPISHRVPDEVAPGKPARAPFVYFGIYRSE